MARVAEHGELSICHMSHMSHMRGKELAAYSSNPVFDKFSNAQPAFAQPNPALCLY